MRPTFDGVIPTSGGNIIPSFALNPARVMLQRGIILLQTSGVGSLLNLTEEKRTPVVGDASKLLSLPVWVELGTGPAETVMEAIR